MVLSIMPRSPRLPCRRESLTAREREVLTLVATGQTNRQIAEALVISEKTAAVHVSSILQKLGVRRRVEAAVLAVLSRQAGADGEATNLDDPRVIGSRGPSEGRLRL